MGGKIRVGTKTQIRLRRGKQLFKSVFTKDRSKVKDTEVKLVKILNEEEAVFIFPSKNNELYILFCESDIVTYAESLDYFIEEDISKGDKNE